MSKTAPAARYVCRFKDNRGNFMGEHQLPALHELIQCDSSGRIFARAATRADNGVWYFKEIGLPQVTLPPPEKGGAR